MNEYPSISVLMSVYNGEKYLSEAIESVLNQTYKDFEFIIINDGSSDNSLEIIKKYQSQDERIVLISRENKGLVASLNEGIEKAKGKYIARMDADDICLSTRFEEQFMFMEKQLDVVVCGSWIRIFANNKKDKIAKYYSNDKQIKSNLLISSCFAHPSVMIRKDSFTKNNIYYNEKFKHAEDYYLWIQLAKTGKFANIPKVLLNYRYLDSSITRLAERNKAERYNIINDIIKNAVSLLNLEISELEVNVHYIISDNNRIRENKIDLLSIENYFDKIIDKSYSIDSVDTSVLKKIMGRRWLYNFSCHLEIKAIFSKYFWYGILSIKEDLL